MFGLQGDKKKKKEEFVFELEKELTNSKKRNEIKKKVEERIQEIKEMLREGKNKKEFDRFALILHGYTSILKVMSRINPK